LTGGKKIAGTGTISADGKVGPIGGIDYKLISAKRSGDQFFLAPTSNCDEVVGHIPSGLRVFSVSTLKEALNVLAVISVEGDVSKLPVCSAK
jgi:PDZ domain-containing protein